MTEPQKEVMTEAQAKKVQRDAEIDKTITFGERGLEVTNLEQAGRFAEWAIRSGLTKAKSVSEAVMAIQIGSELGFSLFRSLMVVHMINGVPCVAVEAQAAKVESDGALQPGTKIFYKYGGEGMDRSCTVWSFPRGGEKIESDPIYFHEFKHLHHKENWKNYPDRMLKARGVGFHVRDFYSASTNNLPTMEEVMDMDAQRGVAAARDVTPPKSPDPLLAKPSKEEPTDAVLVEPKQGCTHPEGFAATEADPSVLVCIECGMIEESQS